MTESLPTSEINNEATERRGQGEMIIRFLEKIHADKFFQNSETAAQFFKESTFEKFKDFLVRINGIARKTPIKKRTTDGKDVVLTNQFNKTFVAYMPPRYEDKEELLKELWAQAKKLDRGEDMGLLLGVGINAIHPFDDANGRTSRLTYTLLHDGYRGTEEEKIYLEQILGQFGRQAINPSPEFIEPLVLNVLKKEYLGIDLHDMRQPQRMRYQRQFLQKLSDTISEDAKKKFDTVIKEPLFGFIALYQYLREHNRLNSRYFPTVYEDKKPKITLLDLSLLAPDMQEEDAEKIIEVYWRVKKMYVQKLIEIIASPDNYRLSDLNFEDYPSVRAFIETNDLSRGSIKDYLKKEIENQIK